MTGSVFDPPKEPAPDTLNPNEVRFFQSFFFFKRDFESVQTFDPNPDLRKNGTGSECFINHFRIYDIKKTGPLFARPENPNLDQIFLKTGSGSVQKYLNYFGSKSGTTPKINPDPGPPHRSVRLFVMLTGRDGGP